MSPKHRNQVETALDAAIVALRTGDVADVSHALRHCISAVAIVREPITGERRVRRDAHQTRATAQGALRV